jgi:hypothetical protein
MTTPEHLAGMLTAFAERVPEDSCIVELGTYHGKGTVALAQGVVLSGNDVEVITVDDYKEKKGWIGERYCPEDAQVFYANIKSVGIHITHSRMNFDDAVKMWTRPIGLLYWDPGCVERFENDWLNWSPFIIPDGVFIVKDTPSGHLGTVPVLDQVIGQGWERFEYWNGVSFLRRTDD